MVLHHKGKIIVRLKRRQWYGIHQPREATVVAPNQGKKIGSVPATFWMVISWNPSNSVAPLSLSICCAVYLCLSPLPLPLCMCACIYMSLCLPSSSRASLPPPSLRKNNGSVVCDHEKKKNMVDLSTHNAIRGKKKMIVLGRSRKHLNTFAAVSAFKYKVVLTTDLIVIGLRNMEYV